MSLRPEEFVTWLYRLDADHTRSAHELMTLLRSHGMRGGDADMREGIRLYVDRFVRRETWVTRAEAAHDLGVSIQRVDQMRREGLLAWERNPHTRAVRISKESLDLLVAQRKLGIRMDPVTISDHTPEPEPSNS